MCEEWKNSLGAFGNWALESGYRDDLTIDRIDVNGNYEPSNCRWIDMKAQGRNRRNNHVETVNGITGTITELAEEYGIKVPTLFGRIGRGWTIEEAINIPVGGIRKRKFHYVTFNGETMTLTQWQERTGIPRRTIADRLKNGWDIEKALTTKARGGK